MTIAIPTTVERLLEARSTRRPMAPLSEADPDLTIELGYAIQDALRAELERRGERMIGWKLAFTSPAGQALTGVKEPAAGFLLSSQYASGAEVPLSGFAGLGVEAEVALRLRTKLVGPGVTAATAALAVEGAVAALELPDFLFSGTPRAADFIANSIHARAIVLGSPLTPLRGLDLALEGVVYEHNGEIVGTHTAAEVMGNPLNALAWLANHLETRGLALKPGDIVISGAISKILRPKAGDTIRARFTRLGSVGIKVVA
ncbi:MAG: fumarylacetoacetate hydrolase family protein [Candidatus Rokubacteria bacterium]|nr:fumarylacetoacetate hydrolase family protein [Candidatus Rokubacteria bacterium]